MNRDVPRALINIVEYVETQITDQVMEMNISSRVAEFLDDAVRDSTEYCSLLIGDILESENILVKVVNQYDEKETLVRIPLIVGDKYQIRLHVWKPSLHTAPKIERAHSHRRYLVTKILCNEYVSNEFGAAGDRGFQFTGRRVLKVGSCYVITPETIHSVSNWTKKNTVSLIIRGPSVRESILYYDEAQNEMASYISQRPIGDLGKSADEEKMNRLDYLVHVLNRIRSELSTRECER